MKPSNSGIPIYLAVFCLLFQNVSGISQQECLSIREAEEDNSRQNFTETSSMYTLNVIFAARPLSQRNDQIFYLMEGLLSLPYNDILEFNKLQEQKHVLENAEPRNCSDEVEIFTMVPAVLFMVFLSASLVILIFGCLAAIMHLRLKDCGPSSTLDDCLIKNIITSPNQGRMLTCDKSADWKSCHFIAFFYLLVIISLRCPFLLTITGLYLTVFLIVYSATGRLLISDNPSSLENCDPSSTLVGCVKKNNINSPNQGRMLTCDKIADWTSCHLIAFLFLLLIMCLTFPFLLPCTGMYLAASIIPAGELWLLNCLKCSHVFTSEYHTEVLTMSIYTTFLFLLFSSLWNICGGLEKVRKHFTHWQVMWAVTWIFLLAFLFYNVSQINDNDNGVCSNKVPGMILALPIKKLALLFLFIMSTGFTSASTYCAETQTAEIDAQGMINCSFPTTFRSVAWFDDVSNDSSFAISCETPCSVKKGPGLQYYDIFQNGSLRIPRVTVQHERPFQVYVYTSEDYFEKQTVYLKVIARPGQRLPTLDCNGITQYHYHKVNGETILTCSFNATRPPVQLTWSQRTLEGDIPVKQQEKTIIENEDSTFNSSVTIDLITTPLGNRMLLFVCKANWDLQGWEKEKEILLDNRGLQSFDGEPNETLYLEQGRQGNVRCKRSLGFLQLWERISSNNGSDMIGFTANGLTRAVATSQDPTISSEGHLIFSSPQVDDEGIYVCAYSHDMRNEVYVVAVTILIAPLPPYIHIKGCKDDNQACSLKAYDQGQISCFVMGVRPSVSLEWIANDGYIGNIAFHASKETTKEYGATSDTEISAEYELISENINCGNNIYVTCRLSGPVSHIVNRNERTVQLTREPCSHEEDKGDGLSTVTVILMSLCAILSVGLCIVVGLIFNLYKRIGANGSHSNTIQLNVLR